MGSDDEGKFFIDLFDDVLEIFQRPLSEFHCIGSDFPRLMGITRIKSGQRLEYSNLCDPSADQAVLEAITSLIYHLDQPSLSSPSFFKKEETSKPRSSLTSSLTTSSSSLTTSSSSLTTSSSSLTSAPSYSLHETISHIISPRKIPNTPKTPPTQLLRIKTLTSADMRAKSRTFSTPQKIPMGAKARLDSPETKVEKGSLPVGQQPSTPGSRKKSHLPLGIHPSDNLQKNASSPSVSFSTFRNNSMEKKDGDGGGKEEGVKREEGKGTGSGSGSGSSPFMKEGDPSPSLSPLPQSQSPLSRPLACSDFGYTKLFANTNSNQNSNTLISLAASQIINSNTESHTNTKRKASMSTKSPSRSPPLILKTPPLPVEGREKREGLDEKKGLGWDLMKGSEKEGEKKSEGREEDVKKSPNPRMRIRSTSTPSMRGVKKTNLRNEKEEKPSTSTPSPRDPPSSPSPSSPSQPSSSRSSSSRSSPSQPSLSPSPRLSQSEEDENKKKIAPPKPKNRPTTPTVLRLHRENSIHIPLSLSARKRIRRELPEEKREELSKYLHSKYVPANLTNFVGESELGRGEIYSVLKCLNQNIIAPAVKKIRFTTAKRAVPLFYKDVQGGWSVTIEALQKEVRVVHHKQEQNVNGYNGTPTDFMFKWELTVILDREIKDKMKKASLRVFDLEFSAQTSPETKQTVTEALSSLINNPVPDTKRRKKSLSRLALPSLSIRKNKKEEVSQK